MKKLLALVMAFLVIGVGATAAMAEDTVGTQKTNRFRIHRMGAMGNGLAISQSDPMDFELLKIGIAGVKLTADVDSAELKVGVLYFGEDKYRLKDVEIGNGSASADIYDGEDQVGTISLDSYPKGDKEVWAGELTLNDVTYNAYVIQVARRVKAMEKAHHIHQYCKNNPARCKAAMKTVGNILCDPEQEGETCRNRIKEFCENNPEDNRCKRLGFEYCRTHLDDADCRAELMERCKANYDDEVCENLGRVYNKLAEDKPKIAQALQKAPAWFVKARERLRNLATDNSGNGDTNDTGNGTGNQGGE